MEIIEIILFCLFGAIRILVRILETAMFLRVLLSIFGMDEEGLLARILFCLTEPILVPVRMLLSRFGLGEDLPVDFSPMITMMLLMILSLFLPVITL